MSSTQTQALERQPVDLAQFSGSSRNPTDITKRLQDAMEVGHLISPMNQCHQMPPFCEVGFSYVLADTAVDRNGKPIRPGEIYKIAKDQYGLAKPFLNRIKRAVGVIWDPQQSARIDDESNAHYVRHFSLGIVMKFDGGVETIKGTKTIDLRDGSARCKKIIAKAVQTAIDALEWEDDPEREGKRRKRRTQPSQQEKQQAAARGRQKALDNIRDARVEIETIAETGSELRALRSLGLKTSYTLAELKKPFIIASLVVTGKHEKPEFEEMFAIKAADRLLDARRHLFGIGSGHAQVPHQLRSAPPPIDAGGDHDPDTDEDLEGIGETIDVDETGEPETTSHASDLDDDERSQGNGNGDDHRDNAYTFPFGDDKGKYLDDSSVSVASLEWLREWCINAIANPDKAQYKAQNESLKQAVEGELRARGVQVDGPPPAAATRGGRKAQNRMQF